MNGGGRSRRAPQKVHLRFQSLQRLALEQVPLLNGFQVVVGVHAEGELLVSGTVDLFRRVLIIQVYVIFHLRIVSYIFHNLFYLI